MDLITGQRTFCIGVSGAGIVNETITQDIAFVDSSGNNINCNYFKLQVGGTNAASKVLGVVAELSGVSHVGDAVTDSLSALSGTPATSGICGIGTVAAYFQKGEEVWHGSNGQVATGVKLVITNIGANADYNIMITYGNLYPLNTLRLAQSYDAGV